MMADSIQIGFAIMSKPHGATEWAKRTTFKEALQPGVTIDGRMKRAREAAEASKQQWQAVEPGTAFAVIDWFHGDDGAWTEGRSSGIAQIESRIKN